MMMIRSTRSTLLLLIVNPPKLRLDLGFLESTVSIAWFG